MFQCVSADRVRALVIALALFHSMSLSAEQVSPSKVQTYTYKVVKGHEIKADVYGAATPGSDKPVMVWIHGGALIFGNRTDAPPEPLASRIVNAGFVLVSINYRLAPETKLPAIIEDIRDAMTWVRETGPTLFGADPERICVAGDSAGGYLTLMSGLFEEPKPKALVAFYGYGDIIGDWYSLPDPHYSSMPAISRKKAYAAVNKGVISDGSNAEGRWRFYMYCRQQGLWPKEVAGWDPRTERKKFIPYCPDQNVTASYPPTILFHGTIDSDVPHSRSERMAAALKKAGIEHELISLEGVEHGFIEDAPMEHEFDRAVAFLKRHVTR